MNYTPHEIEKAIEEILGIPDTKPKQEPRKRGRKPQGEIPVWSLEFYNPYKNRTFALISMCIKEDLNQSIEQLALKLSAYKCRKVSECLLVLRRLQRNNLLGYYDNEQRLRKWDGKEAGHGLEGSCS